MKGWSTIKAIAAKEFRHIFRDKVSCLILFFMPVTILIIFGYALSFDVLHYEIAVVNTSHEVAGERLFARLEANPKLKVTQRADRYDTAGEIMASSHVRAVVVYGKDGIDLFLDGTNPYVTKGVSSMICSVIQDFYSDETGNISAKRAKTPIRFIYNPTSNKEYMPIPGLVLMVFILVGSIVLGTSLNKEKAQGTFMLLRLTPVGNLELILGKSLPYFLISLFHIAIVVFTCNWFNIRIVGSLALFIGVCLVFSICCQTLGLLMSAWFDKPLDILILSWIVLFIPNVFLSGFIFPISSMEGVVKSIAECLPGSSFNEAFKAVAYKGTGIDAIIRPIAVLSAESVISFAFALIGLNREIKR